MRRKRTAKADEKKESGKKSVEVASRNDKNALAGTAGIGGAEDGVKVNWLRLVGTANGKVDGIAGSGVLPKSNRRDRRK